MGFLESILGGGQNSEPDYRDFVNRYEQGAAHEGYSDQEVANRYQQVSRDLPADVYQESAQEAFSRMSPQERRQFGQYLQQQTRQQNLNFPDLDGDGQDDRYQNSNYLAQATSRIHQQQPDLLGQLLGGAAGMMGGNQGNIFSNPLAKGAMAGIAAIAAKKLMDRGGTDRGQYGNVRPASEDPYGDPGNVRPASEDPYGDPADQQSRW
jgi:hypothetical protein